MIIINRKITELIPYVNNARTHSDEQVLQICSSIKEFGFTNPVLIDGENGIIAGHGRLMAAKKLGMEEVPTIELSHLSEAQRKAYILADNKLALNSGWDNDLLAIEFAELGALGFDLELTGFTLDEIDALTPEEIPPGLTDEDAVPELPIEPVTKLGDVWLCGNHRVMCGDSTSVDAVDKLMDGNKADMVWTDPPYNVAIEGIAGKIMNDDMDNESFKNFLSDVYACYFMTLKAGGVIYVAHADSERANFTQCYKESGLKLSQVLIWVKQSGTLSRQDFNWQHEPILYGWKEGAAHYFCGDFTRTTIIDDDIDLKKMTKPQLQELVNSYRTEQKTTALRENRPSRSELHPTMKPVNLVQRMIEWSSVQKDVVLDLFGGSGSTLMACVNAGRYARLMELDPKYCDVIVKRWQDFTGQQATLESTGEYFGVINDTTT
jgi:DNA modification methylase